MKKLLTLVLTFASFAFIGSTQSADSVKAASLGRPQVQIELGRRQGRRYRNRDWARGERTGYGRTFTRVVRRGWHTYQETYQVRYLPNGMTQTVLVSRVRLN